ncbi:MAG: phosphatase PAP2 family protein [Myxococcota bacterium]|nr:phosphatase PAP2 family protein [Myxococcota bacterium]
MKTLRKQFELSDMGLIFFHVLAIVGLSIVARGFAEYEAQMLQSGVLVLLVVLTALKLGPWNYKLGMLARVALTSISCPLLYERAHLAVKAIWGQPKLEHYVVATDKMLFGGNASEFLQAFHHPLLTEYLQFSYMTYFILPLVLGLFLMASRKWHKLPTIMLAVVLTSSLVSLGYVLIPLRSPFLVAQESPHLMSYDFELYGLWATDSLRQWLLDSTQMRHDCFPSGHTALSTTTLGMAYLLHRRAFWVLLPLVLSIVFSTLYLRYHYLIDVAAGLGLTAIMVWAVPLLERGWQRVRVLDAQASQVGAREVLASSSARSR